MSRLLYLIASTLPLWAQTCATQPIVPVSARLEGYTELMGDLVATCTGGTATASGAAIPILDITVTLSVPVTNRKNVGDNFLDALLMMDEPHSVANPNVPLTMCVDCSITGTGNGVGVYSGVAGRPNVFQGELTGTHTVRFRVPFDSGQPRTLRVVNLRGDVTRVPASPNLVSATLMIPGATMANGSQNLAMVHPGIVQDRKLNFVSSASWCTGANRHLLTDGGTSVNPLTRPQSVLSLNEGAIESWRAKSAAVATANNASIGFQPTYPADGNQNISGFPFDTEAGFHNNGVSNPGGEYPQLPANAAFPATRGLQRAGLANQGTRIFVRFPNPPSGMRIFLPASIDLVDRAFDGVAPPTGLAVMVAPDQNGNYVRMTPNGNGLAAMTTDGANLRAVYEVLRSNPAVLEGVDIPVYVAANSIPGTTPSLRVTASLGPTSPVSGADASAPVPRFAEGVHAVSFLAFAGSATDCDRPDLVVAPNTENSTTAVAFNVVNTSPVAATGLVTLRVAPPSNVTLGNPATPGWTCTPSPVTCTTPGPIEPNGARFIRFPATVTGTSLGQPGTASVSNDSDAYPGNNTAEFNVMERTMRMGTQPSGLLYSVNDVFYSGRRTAPFEEPSAVTTVPSQVSRLGIPYNFKNWSDSGAISHTLRTQPTVELIASFDRPPSVMSCSFGNAKLIRAEGRTELGDFELICTGGTPVPQGTAIPPVDVRLSTPTPITSRIVFPGISEALLVVGSPRSTANPNTPLLACGAAGSGSNGSGECRVISAGAATYDGAAGHPNVFQGLTTGSSSILFSQVPINPPGPGNNLILRVSNLRLNASAVRLGTNLIPASIQPSVTFSPQIGFFQETSAFSSPLFITGGFEPPSSAPTVVNIQACRDVNAAIYLDSSRPLETALPGGAQARVTVTEGFPNAFRSINQNTQFANAGSAVLPLNYIGGAKQDTTLDFFGTETGLYAGPGAALTTGTIALGSSPEFPAVRGLNTSGLVDSGTRIYVKFTGIPARVKLFIPVAANVASALTGVRLGTARLTLAAANGSGAFSPVGGNAAGLLELPSSGGSATAFYEVISADAFAQERIEIAVAAAIAGTQQPAEIGTIRVETGFAPLDTSDNAAGFGTHIPRFRPTGQASSALIEIGSCSLPDLAIQAERSNPPSPVSTTTYEFTVRNLGSVASIGTTSVAVTVQSGRVRTLSGSGWSCNAAAPTCNRTDSLAAGAAFPVVALVLEPYTAASSETITAAVSSGADSNSVNNSFRDTIANTGWGSRFNRLDPVRVADTRLSPQGSMTAGSTRVFQVDPKCGATDGSAFTEASAYVLNVTVVPKRTLGFLTIWPGGARPTVSTLNSLDGRVKAAAAIVPAGLNCSVSVYVTEDTDVILDLNGYFRVNSGGAFYPTGPCRLVDSRSTPPARALAPLTETLVDTTTNSCGIPVQADAYSLNATVVPRSLLGYLTVWPGGGRPTVSTLNAVTGTVVANAAMVARRTSFGSRGEFGHIQLFASEATDFLLDINGYFRSDGTSGGLNFYPIPPCRISDTRNATGPFGGPAHAANAVRDYPIAASSCGIPSTAKAYAINATVVPNGVFGYLTLWPSGTGMPVVSTLNAVDGAITSNLAIVPAGSNGAISTFVTHEAHLILDVTGYFAP
jgi:hypothetical protein